jgi:ribonuclease HII
VSIDVAGVDEAGRGALAGPVMAGAVILDPARPIAGLRDSKRLSARARETLAQEIEACALAWAVAAASHEEIDRINILRASHLAMQRAVLGLALAPGRVLVDGNLAPAFACPAQTIIGGDAIEPAIMAASILAKVHRDRFMQALCADFPVYGFAVHKGYPTSGHIDALKMHGPCPSHRRSFGPVARCGVLT